MHYLLDENTFIIRIQRCVLEVKKRIELRNASFSFSDAAQGGGFSQGGGFAQQQAPQQHQQQGGGGNKFKLILVGK